MLLHIGYLVQPSAQADQRRWPGGHTAPGTAARASDAAPGVGQMPIDCSTKARGPACKRLNARCAWLSRSLVLRLPTDACQWSRPWPCPESPVQQAGDLGDVRHRIQPR